MHPSRYISRLRLSHFRNYASAALDLDGRHLVLVGANGAGKTNLLEAVSLLSPGRGLRGAPFEDVAAQGSDGLWAVAATVETPEGPVDIGTGAGGPEVGRRVRINGANARTIEEMSAYLRVLWLTPAMDGLFTGPASERRRFLDRLVLAVDAEHPGRVTALERALRSRNRLLEETTPNPQWLDAIEHETAELAVAVAAQRAETVQRLQAALASRRDDAFPSAEIALDGWIERLVPDHPAVEIEDRYRGILKSNRQRDAAAGRTLDGPHLTDLAVVYPPKGIAAADASTGEQKALLIGLVLAHAELLAQMIGSAPLLLLDEVVAHLDPDRRRALYDALRRLDTQVWMTGADPAGFAEIVAHADRFTVSAGRATRD